MASYTLFFTHISVFLSPEVGHFALALACALAVLQACLPTLGLWLCKPSRREAPSLQSPLLQFTKPLTYSHTLALLLAWACLITASLGDDFSLRLIAETSATTKPWPYKIAGLWGNHEGSLLLWVTLLSLWSSLLATRSHQSPLHPTKIPARLQLRLIALLGFISAGFLLFCLTTSNPFLRLWPVPLEGMGMNPLLQDPGLALHPPLLYSGYVGFAVPFSFAISALIDGRADANWAYFMRPWVVSAWSLLTLGIALGSWWSYAVLGWGGYWFWDPVENAALIPWLTATALLHSVIVAEKRSTLLLWCMLLAIATFSLSLSGTFLVRSGILNSVHAFANDPARGVFILTLLAIFTGGALLLFAARGHKITTPYWGGFHLVSREGTILINNMLLCTLCAVILTGTMYPPFMQLLFGRTLSVGKPFFDATTIPLALPLLAIIGIGITLPWRSASPTRTWRRLTPALLITLGNALPAFWLFASPLAGLCALFALWVITSSVLDLAYRLRSLPSGSHSVSRLPRSLYAACCAHIGVGITILGICGMATTQERIIEATAGTHISLAGQDWCLDRLTSQHGPNFEAIEAQITVRAAPQSPHIITILRPQIRIFPAQNQRTLHVAITHRLFGDLYAVLGSVKNDHDYYSAVLRLHYNPLASWIWLGGIIMACGGALSLLPRIPLRIRRKQHV